MVTTHFYFENDCFRRAWCGKSACDVLWEPQVIARRDPNSLSRIGGRAMGRVDETVKRFALAWQSAQPSEKKLLVVDNNQ